MKSSYITYITWFVILVFTLQSLTVYADITGNTLQQQTRLRQPEFIKAAIRIVEAASRDQEQAGILLSELAERLPSDIPAMIVYQPDSQTVYIADGTVIVSVRKAGSNTSQALPPLATLLQEERIGDVEIKILKDNMATRAELAALENVQIICKRDQQTDLAAKGQNALGVVLSGGALGAMLADEPALSLVMLALSVLFWGLPVIGMVKRRKVRKKKARPAAAGTHSRKAGPAKEKDGNLPVIPGTDSILAQEDALLRVVAEYPDILCYKYELYSTLGTAYQQQALACGIKGSVEEARVMQERAVAYFRQAVWAYYHGRAVPLLREDMQAAGERLSSSGVVNPDLVIDKLVALADEVEETEGDDELDRLRELLPEGLPEGTDVVWGIMGELAGAELSEEEREIEETVYALERCVLGRSEGYAEMAVLVCQDNGRLLAGLPFELVHAFMVVVFNSASLAREEKLQVFNTIRTCEKTGIAHLRAWSCSYIGQILVEQGSHNQALVVLLQGIGLVEGAFDTNIPLSQWILRALYFYSAFTGYRALCSDIELAVDEKEYAERGLSHIEAALKNGLSKETSRDTLLLFRVLFHGFLGQHDLAFQRLRQLFTRKLSDPEETSRIIARLILLFLFDVLSGDYPPESCTGIFKVICGNEILLVALTESVRQLAVNPEYVELRQGFGNLLRMTVSLTLSFSRRSLQAPDKIKLVKAMAGVDFSAGEEQIVNLVTQAVGSKKGKKRKIKNVELFCAIIEFCKTAPTPAVLACLQGLRDNKKCQAKQIQDVLSGTVTEIQRQIEEANRTNYEYNVSCIQRAATGDAKSAAFCLSQLEADDEQCQTVFFAACQQIVDEQRNSELYSDLFWVIEFLRNWAELEVATAEISRFFWHYNLALAKENHLVFLKWVEDKAPVKIDTAERALRLYRDRFLEGTDFATLRTGVDALVNSTGLAEEAAVSEDNIARFIIRQQLEQISEFQKLLAKGEATLCRVEERLKKHSAELWVYLSPRVKKIIRKNIALDVDLGQEGGEYLAVKTINFDYLTKQGISSFSVPLVSCGAEFLVVDSTSFPPGLSYQEKEDLVDHLAISLLADFLQEGNTRYNLLEIPGVTARKMQFLSNNQASFRGTRRYRNKVLDFLEKQESMFSIQDILRTIAEYRQLTGSAKSDDELEEEIRNIIWACIQEGQILKSKKEKAFLSRIKDGYCLIIFAKDERAAMMPIVYFSSDPQRLMGLCALVGLGVFSQYQRDDCLGYEDLRETVEDAFSWNTRETQLCLFADEVTGKIVAVQEELGRRRRVFPKKSWLFQPDTCIEISLEEARERKIYKRGKLIIVWGNRLSKIPFRITVPKIVINPEDYLDDNDDDEQATESHPGIAGALAVVLPTIIMNLRDLFPEHSTILSLLFGLSLMLPMLGMARKMRKDPTAARKRRKRTRRKAAASGKRQQAGVAGLGDHRPVSLTQLRNMLDRDDFDVEEFIEKSGKAIARETAKKQPDIEKLYNLYILQGQGCEKGHNYYVAAQAYRAAVKIATALQPRFGPMLGIKAMVALGRSCYYLGWYDTAVNYFSVAEQKWASIRPASPERSLLAKGLGVAGALPAAPAGPAPALTATVPAKERNAEEMRMEETIRYYRGMCHFMLADKEQALVNLSQCREQHMFHAEGMRLLLTDCSESALRPQLKSSVENKCRNNSETKNMALWYQALALIQENDIEQASVLFERVFAANDDVLTSSIPQAARLIAGLYDQYEEALTAALAKIDFSKQYKKINCLLENMIARTALSPAIIRSFICRISGYSMDEYFALLLNILMAKTAGVEVVPRIIYAVVEALSELDEAGQQKYEQVLQKLEQAEPALKMYRAGHLSLADFADFCARFPEMAELMESVLASKRHLQVVIKYMPELLQNPELAGMTEKQIVESTVKADSNLQKMAQDFVKNNLLGLSPLLVRPEVVETAMELKYVADSVAIKKGERIEEILAEWEEFEDWFPEGDNEYLVMMLRSRLGTLLADVGNERAREYLCSVAEGKVLNEAIRGDAAHRVGLIFYQATIPAEKSGDRERVEENARQAIKYYRLMDKLGAMAPMGHLVLAQLYWMADKETQFVQMLEKVSENSAVILPLAEKGVDYLLYVQRPMSQLVLEVDASAELSEQRKRFLLLILNNKKIDFFTPLLNYHLNGYLPLHLLMLYCNNELTTLGLERARRWLTGVDCQHLAELIEKLVEENIAASHKKKKKKQKLKGINPLLLRCAAQTASGSLAILLQESAARLAENNAKAAIQAAAAIAERRQIEEDIRRGNTAVSIEEWEQTLLQFTPRTAEMYRELLLECEIEHFVNKYPTLNDIIVRDILIKAKERNKTLADAEREMLEILARVYRTFRAQREDIIAQRAEVEALIEAENYQAAHEKIIELLTGIPKQGRCGLEWLVEHIEEEEQREKVRRHIRELWQQNLFCCSMVNEDFQQAVQKAKKTIGSADYDSIVDKGVEEISEIVSGFFYMGEYEKASELVALGRRSYPDNQRLQVSEIYLKCAGGDQSVQELYAGLKESADQQVQYDLSVVLRYLGYPQEALARRMQSLTKFTTTDYDFFRSIYEDTQKRMAVLGRRDYYRQLDKMVRDNVLPACLPDKQRHLLLSTVAHLIELGQHAEVLDILYRLYQQATDRKVKAEISFCMLNSLCGISRFRQPSADEQKKQKDILRVCLSLDPDNDKLLGRIVRLLLDVRNAEHLQTVLELCTDQQREGIVHSYGKEMLAEAADGNRAFIDLCAELISNRNEKGKRAHKVDYQEILEQLLREIAQDNKDILFALSCKMAEFHPQETAVLMSRFGLLVNVKGGNVHLGFTSENADRFCDTVAKRINSLGEGLEMETLKAAEAERELNDLESTAAERLAETPLELKFMWRTILEDLQEIKPLIEQAKEREEILAAAESKVARCRTRIQGLEQAFRNGVEYKQLTALAQAINEVISGLPELVVQRMLLDDLKNLRRIIAAATRAEEQYEGLLRKAAEFAAVSILPDSVLTAIRADLATGAEKYDTLNSVRQDEDLIGSIHNLIKDGKIEMELIFAVLAWDISNLLLNENASLEAEEDDTRLRAMFQFLMQQAQEPALRPLMNNILKPLGLKLIWEDGGNESNLEYNVLERQQQLNDALAIIAELEQDLTNESEWASELRADFNDLLNQLLPGEERETTACSTPIDFILYEEFLIRVAEFDASLKEYEKFEAKWLEYKTSLNIDWVALPAHVKQQVGFIFRQIYTGDREGEMPILEAEQTIYRFCFPGQSAAREIIGFYRLGADFLYLSLPEVSAEIIDEIRIDILFSDLAMLEDLPEQILISENGEVYDSSEGKEDIVLAGKIRKAFLERLRAGLANGGITGAIAMAAVSVGRIVTAKPWGEYDTENDAIGFVLRSGRTQYYFVRFVMNAEGSWQQQVFQENSFAGPAGIIQHIRAIDGDADGFCDPVRIVTQTEIGEYRQRLLAPAPAVQIDRACLAPHSAMKELHFQLLKQRLRQNLSQIFPLAELSGCKHFYDLDYYNTEDVRDAFIDSTGIDVMAVIEIAGKSYQQNMDLILAGEFTGLEVEGLKEWLQEQHLTVKIAIDETETVELELNEYLDDFMRCLRLTDRLDPEIKTAIQSKVPQNMRKAVSRRLLGVSAAGENKLFLLRFISEKHPADAEYFWALSLLITLLKEDGDIRRQLQQRYHDNLRKHISFVTELYDFEVNQSHSSPLLSNDPAAIGLNSDLEKENSAILYLLDFYKTPRQKKAFAALASIAGHRFADRKDESDYAEIVFSRDYYQLALSLEANARYVKFERGKDHLETEAMQPTLEERLGQIGESAENLWYNFGADGWIILVKTSQTGDFVPGVYMYGEVLEDGSVFIENTNFIRLGRHGLGCRIYADIGKALEEFGVDNTYRVYKILDNIHSLMAVTRYLLNNNHIPAVTQAAVWGIMAEAQALLAIKDHDVFISRYPPLREKFYIFVYPFMRGVDLPSEYVSRRILMGKMLHRRLGVAGMRVNVIEEDEKITLLLEGVFQPEKHMRNISCRQSGIEQAL